MGSPCEGAGSGEPQQLNPQAYDFIPAPAAQKAVDETQYPNGFIPPNSRRKKRRGGPKRKQYLPFPDLHKTSSASSSSMGTSVPYQPVPDKFRHTLTNNQVGSRVDPIQDTVASNRPIVSENIGAGPRDKENQGPVYGNALTWKSSGVKAKDEYNRVRRSVRTMAPEQFVDRAKPSMEPANIFPRSVNDWQMFKSESVVDRMAELAQDMKKMENMVKATENMEKDGVTRAKRSPKSCFGPDGKIFKDSLGPVLAQPTIWSEGHLKSDVGKASWPTRAEMLEDGDSRENAQVQTRGGRHLPMPRYPQDPNKSYVSFKDRPVIPQNPMDQVGPIYRDGNGQVLKPTPAEIDKANEEMNNDPTFEAHALNLLGSDLMDEIGRWSKPVVPAWQERERQEEKAQQEAVEAASMLQQGMSRMQLGGTSASEIQTPSSASGAMPKQGGPSTNTSQPMSTASSYQDQSAHAANMQLPHHANARHGQGGPSVPSVGSSNGSALDMRGWILIGRHVIPGTNVGESFWMSPWGETVVYRDDWIRITRSQ